VNAIRSDLYGHVLQEKAAREGITSSLRALDANLVVLALKAEGRQPAPHELRNVLTSVREISVREAAKLESIATIGGVIPEEYTPILALARRDDNSRAAASFFNTTTPSVQPAYLGKMLLTRSGAWQVVDRQILFKWDGGSATIRPMNDVSSGEIARKVELFNSVSRAAGHAGVVAPSGFTSQTKSSVRPNIAPRTNGASGVLKRSQAPRRVDVVKRPEVPPARKPPSPY
jgi:hypothetical protein